MRYITLLFLFLMACGPSVNGTVLSPDIHKTWYDAIDTFVDDWNAQEAHPANPPIGSFWHLPSIQGETCQRWIRETSIVQYESAQEWMDNRGTCPCMPPGEVAPTPCDERRGCVAGSFSVTGPAGPRSKRPYIFLSPGETADGHEITVRHEMAHILAGCIGWDGDIGHARQVLWNGQYGLVWRPNQSPDAWMDAPL